MSITTYLLSTIPGFLVLGDHMKYNNIVKEMDAGWIIYAVNVLMTSHFLMTFLIVINPVNQELDKIFKLKGKGIDLLKEYRILTLLSII